MKNARWLVTALVGDGGRALGRLDREFKTKEEAEAFAEECRATYAECDFSDVYVRSLEELEARQKRLGLDD